MALQDIITKNSINRSVTVSIIDFTDRTPETGVLWNTAGIDLWYRREGEAVTSITEATLGALGNLHSDGGFLHISDGIYRLDLPDAAFLAGANHVDYGGTVPNMVVFGGRIRLVDTTLEDAIPTKAQMDTAIATVATPAQVNAQVLDVVNTDLLVAGKTIADSLDVISASVAGKVSGAGTATEVFTDMAGATKITVTADAQGNRTTVVYAT